MYSLLLFRYYIFHSFVLKYEIEVFVPSEYIQSFMRLFSPILCATIDHLEVRRTMALEGVSQIAHLSLLRARSPSSLNLLGTATGHYREHSHLRECSQSPYSSTTYPHTLPNALARKAPAIHAVSLHQWMHYGGVDDIILKIQIGDTSAMNISIDSEW